MRALITGCAGFAGSHLAEYLLQRNHEVIALVKEQDSLTNLETILPYLQVECADVRDADRVLQVLRETKPQRIYHLAAMTSPIESLGNPRLNYEVNFGGTLNLLCAWRDSGMDCRFLYVSSVEVYGTEFSGQEPLSEEAPLQPANPYGASKAAAELLAFQFYKGYGLPIVRVRPFNHTGPRQSSAFVCSSFAKQIAEIELGLQPPVVNVGNLKVSRDFSDVRDIVAGYHLLLEKGEPGDVYQLCSGRAVSIETVLRILTALAPQSIQIAVDESKMRDHDVPELWGDPSKARRAVGWRVQYELETTLRDLKLCWEKAVRSEYGLSRPLVQS